jgi:hypothetical protein
MPSLASGSKRAADIVYALSAVDKSGRVADRTVVRAMGWAPGTRVSIRECGGTIVVAPAVDGVHRINDRGHLPLPLPVRRGCLCWSKTPATAVELGFMRRRGIR